MSAAAEIADTPTQSGGSTSTDGVWQRIEQVVADAGLDDDQIEDLSFDLEAWLDSAAAQSPHADALRDRLIDRIAALDSPATTPEAAAPDEAGEARHDSAEALDTPPADEESESELPEAVDFEPGTAILVPDDPKDRARANLDVIGVLKVLDSEDRFATPDEQRVLATWSGWGAVPEVFAHHAIGWDDERAEARALLDTAQWLQARDTVPNAHYTDPRIAAVMWQALTRAGFTDGRVLEPGCGSGTFIAHAPQDALMVGVEVDPVTARVAAGLYPTRAQVRNEGFEETRVETNSFAAAIGNVPFGNYRLYDPAHNPSNHTVHNHFLIKSLDLVGPGGWVAVITSQYTAEALDARGRREMADRADLVGAVRLPGNTFRRVAGTNVVTDILLWRVREEGREPTTDTRLFLGTGKLRVREKTDYGAYEVREFEVNSYFAEHPGHILGRPSYVSTKYGGEELWVDGPLGDELATLLAQRLDRIVDDAVEAGLGLTANAETTALSDADTTTGLVTPAVPEDGIAVGTLRWSEESERIEVHNGDDWDQAAVRGKRQAQEWRALLGLRDVATLLVRAQLDGRDAHERAALRSELNHRYDTYLTKYGYINRFKWIEPPEIDDARHRARLDKKIQAWRADAGSEGRPFAGAVPDEVFEQLSEQAWQSERERFKKQSHLEGIIRHDPTMSVVYALEHFDEETHRATKAAIFTSDIVHAAPTPPTHADSVQDAIAICLDESNTIDLTRIAGLLDCTVTDVETQLEATGLAFRSTDHPDVWINAPAYLSGNVRRKLATAREASGSDPRYRANAAALTVVAPPRKNIVSVRLGAPWVEPADYQQFLRDTFSIPSDQGVLVQRVDGEWLIQVDTNYPRWRGELIKWGLAPKAHQGQREGGFNFEDPTADERGVAYSGVAGGAYDPIDIIEDLCNSKPIRVNKSKDFHAAIGGDVLHARATRAAQSKARRLAKEFENWALDSDPARRERLLDRYNDLFNSVVAPKFSGAHMSLPGLGTHYTPFTYQRDAVARIISEQSVLLDHVVGAGKTGTMVMAAMELRRLGLARQPWMVVPNHIVDQVAREAQQWYPAARVLHGSAATDPPGRRRLIAQSAAQDWDLVIVPASAFKLIPTSAQTRTAFIHARIHELNEALNDVVGKKATKIVEVRLKTAKQQLIKLLDSIERDTGFDFENSGCDYLFVDEAHLYKNLLRTSNIDELACTPGSQKAMDLLLKLEYLRGKRKREATAAGIPADAYIERVATFATGTPVANSLSELWVMTNYLRPDLLADAEVKDLDMWGATFTATRETIELNASGSRFVPRTRVGRFVNSGDLIGMTSVFTDSVGRDQITESLPELAGGERTVITFTPSQEVRDFIADLGYRADVMDPARMDIDNSLKVANDGRNVTLDPRSAHLDPPQSVSDRLEYLQNLADRSGFGEDLVIDEQFLAAMETGHHASEHAEESTDGGQLRATVVANQILAVHAETWDNLYLDELGEPSPITGGLQIVFCDRSTPKKDQRTWTIYQAIKDQLIAGGMDPSGIRFIHDYRSASAKANLFSDCKSGKVSVLFGSTEKMGTGANIQNRATALHHVDVPWRPADLEQREGRIIRRHNQNHTAHIFVYIAEKTFDTYMWQVLERKAFFIEQRRLADRNARDIEDLDSDSLAENAAMIKAIATGDDRYIRQIELESLVAELQAEQDAYFSATRSADRETESLQAAIPGHHTAITALEAAVAAIEQRQPDDPAPPPSVLNVPYSERPVASRALVEALREAAGLLRSRPVTEARTVANIGGFDIETRYSTSGGELYIGLAGLSVPPRVIELEKLYLDPKKTNAVKSEDRDKALAHLASGVMTRIENLVDELPNALDNRRWQRQLDTERLDKLQTEQPAGFERSAELKAAYDELDTLQRQLREEATSPEALAQREALHQRLTANGRHHGWSLMLNATPAKCQQLGYDDPAQIRAVMAQRQDEALIKSIEEYVAERSNNHPKDEPDRSVQHDSEGAVAMALVAKTIANKATESSSKSGPRGFAAIVPFPSQIRDQGFEVD